MKSDFEKLSELWEAIKDIDEIVNSTSEAKIDEVINATKNLDKSLLDTDSQDKIIAGFRNGLLKIYKDLLESLNTGIDNLGGLSTKSISKTKPADSPNTTVNKLNNNGSTQEYLGKFGGDNCEEPIDDIKLEESLEPIKTPYPLFNGFSTVVED